MHHFAEYVIREANADLRPHPITGHQPGLPMRSLLGIHDEECPALAFPGAKTAGTPEHLLDRGDVNRIQPDLGIPDDDRSSG